MTTLKDILDEVSFLDDRDFRYNREIYEDVKEAVLNFKQCLELQGDFSAYTRKRFIEIFGDFEK